MSFLMKDTELENIIKVYSGSVHNYDNWMDSWAEKIAPARLLKTYSSALGQTARDAGHLLEIGVGTGRNMPLYGNAREVLGIDITLAALTKASANIPKGLKDRYVLTEMNSEKLDLASSSIDAIISTFHLCVTPHMEQAIDEMVRVLKPGGRAFVFEYQHAKGADLRRSQDFLADTFVSRGLEFQGKPVVLWNPTRDVIRAFTRRRSAFRIEKLERFEKSVMLSKALLVLTRK